jgi:hypothetical protein
MRFAIAVLVVTGTTHAQRLDTFVELSTDASVIAPRAIGASYMAMSELGCPAGEPCSVDVLDVRTSSVVSIDVPREPMQRRFAPNDTIPPAGTLVSYDGNHAGFLFEDRLGADHVQAFAELDVHRAKLGRSIRIAQGNAETRVIGTHDGVVWFGVAIYDGPRRPDLHYAHDNQARQFVIRTLDLATLRVRDVAAVDLPHRPEHSSLDEEMTVQHSADYSHVAVFEYWESVAPLSPPGRGFVIDTDSGTAFSVEVPPVVYASAFSPDGRFLYCSSDETGALVRIDLAAQRIERTVRGPKHTGNAAITADGKSLLLFSSPAKTYVAFDLDSLTAQELKLPAGLAPAFELIGAAALSDDGAHLLVQDPPTVSKQRWHLIAL